MNRRQFLAGTTMLVPAGIAGCLGNANAPKTSDEIAVKTHHQSTNLLEDYRPVAEQLEQDTPASYQTLITDRTEADSRLRSEDETEEFIQETDFDESYLILVVAGDWSSDYTVELMEIARTDADLHVVIETRSPSGDHTMDASHHSLLIRVTDERSKLPEEISVEIDGETTGSSEVD